MKIELRPIDQIQPYAKNPRRIPETAVAAVAASIRTYGWRQPLVVDAHDVLIVGHARLLAARQLGMQQVPVHVATDLTPEQVRGYRIADNQTGALSQFDLDLLKVEMADLAALNFDLGSLGFGDDELKVLLAPPPNAGLTDPNAVPQPPDEPVTKRGDGWTLGQHALLCGDSTDVRDVQRLMNGDRATMCFIDPPWNVAIGADANPRHRQRRGLVNDDLSSQQFEDFLSAFVLAMKPVVTGDIYIVLGAAEWPTLDRVLRGHGYHWSATVIWTKDQFVLGRSKYHRRYEPIWYGWSADGKSSFCGGRDQDDV